MNFLLVYISRIFILKGDLFKQKIQFISELEIFIYKSKYFYNNFPNINSVKNIFNQFNCYLFYLFNQTIHIDFSFIYQKIFTH